MPQSQANRRQSSLPLQRAHVTYRTYYPKPHFVDARPPKVTVCFIVMLCWPRHFPSQSQSTICHNRPSSSASKSYGNLNKRGVACFITPTHNIPSFSLQSHLNFIILQMHQHASQGKCAILLIDAKQIICSSRPPRVTGSGISDED